ncbi:MAG: helix-turn-helix domain-containing protein [Candidatus Ventricola sp.]
METAQQILKAARVKAGMTQLQVAAMLSVSVDQVKRMEYGTWIPEMSDVDLLEEQLHEPGLFRRWARAQFPEISKHFGASDGRDYGLLGAIVNTKHQMNDVLALHEKVERDALDGRIDDPILREKYERELQEARQAIDASLQKIKEVNR